jgi:hypothetical protein
MAGDIRWIVVPTLEKMSFNMSISSIPTEETQESSIEFSFE